jgi:hypothetical protein
MSGKSSRKSGARPRRKTGTKTISSRREIRVVPRRKPTKRLPPECIQVSVEGSLRFDDPGGGRSKKRGRPMGTLDRTKLLIQKIAKWLLAGEKQRAIARKAFPGLNEETAYTRTRSFIHRYRPQIQAEMRGQLLGELEDSMQDLHSKKPGRPSGKLMSKTLERIESANRYSLAGKSQYAMAPKLFRGLSKEVAYARTRDFFRKYRSLILRNVTNDRIRQ